MDIGAGEYGSHSEELSAVLAAAVEALDGLPGSVHRLAGGELSDLLTTIDRLGALAGAGRFTVTAEAVQRGEVVASQAGSTLQWVAERCPSLDAREAGVVAKAVRELSDQALTESRPAVSLEAVREAVAAGRLSVPAACVVVSEWRQLGPLVDPAAAEAVVAGLVEIGVAEGATGVRGLRPALLARYGLGERLQDLEDRHRSLTVLSCGRDIGGGVHEYRMRLAAEARAVVEAALNAASAPRPMPRGDSSGGRDLAGRERDRRTMEQRRGDALVEVCRRAVSRPGLSTGSTTGSSSGSSTGSPDVGDLSSSLSLGTKAMVMVTIGLDELRSRSRPGVLVGGVDAGTLLGPETVRRLTCDGAVVPVVVDRDGHVLHFGRTRRWFSPSQVRALWWRDRHCTFPGCRTPASWCDAHHVVHYVDGGPTDLSNVALLCGRHHTVVHRDRLIATVTGATNGVSTGMNLDTTQGTTGVAGGQVTWDQTPGSYDRALARGPTTRPAA